MTLHYIVTSNVQLAPEGGQLVPDRADARFGLLALTGDFERIGTVVVDPVIVPLTPLMIGTALLSGEVDAFYTSDRETFDRLVADFGTIGGVRFLVFDAATGQVQIFAPDAPGAPPQPDPPTEPPTAPIDPPPPDDPGPTGRVEIDAALADAGTGPYRLVALPDLGPLTLPQIDGGIIAVTGESQRAELLDALAGLGVTVEVVVSERFSDSLGLFNAGAVDLILVPVTALVASGSPDAPSAVDGPPLSGPPDVAPVTGAVVGRDGAPIDGLRLVFRPEEDGAATVEALTGPLGQFSLGLPPAVAGRLDADLAFDPGGRDLGAITTADALAVLRLSVGLSAARGRETTAADLVAADVLGTGTVTAADALALLRASVGLPSEAAPRYVLVDAGLAEAPAAGPAVPDLSPIFGVAPLQLTAILVGDVI